VSWTPEAPVPAKGGQLPDASTDDLLGAVDAAGLLADREESGG